MFFSFAYRARVDDNCAFWKSAAKRLISSQSAFIGNHLGYLILDLIWKKIFNLKFVDDVSGTIWHMNRGGDWQVEKILERN